MTRILLIEDDGGTAAEILLELTAAGHDVRHVGSLASAATVLSGDGGDFDLLILDRQLPDGEGLALLSDLRGQGRRTPALVLSALGSLDDRVRGLRAGGDDYLPKPFALVELTARVEALLRRPNDTRETRLIVGPLDLDLLTGRATRAGRDLELLPRELKLLDYMVRRPGGSSPARCYSKMSGVTPSSPIPMSSMSIWAPAPQGGWRGRGAADPQRPRAGLCL